MPDRTLPGCTGKRPYRTPGDARRAAKLHRRISAQRLHTYRCPFCTRWHLTSQTGARSRAEVSQAMVTLAAHRQHAPGTRPARAVHAPGTPPE